MKSLVIVESGAKAKKIKGFLSTNFPDQDWQVEACVGHVRDLADKETAVDPNNWENLKWEYSSKGKKVMKQLRSLCKETELLYLATDPDREGEAIAWHLLSDFKSKKLLDNVDIIRNIPTIIIQGRYDVVCPPTTAYELHSKWPESELVIAPFSGHSAFEKEITHELIKATNKFIQN